MPTSAANQFGSPALERLVIGRLVMCSFAPTPQAIFPMWPTEGDPSRGVGRIKANGLVRKTLSLDVAVGRKS